MTCRAPLELRIQLCANLHAHKPVLPPNTAAGAFAASGMENGRPSHLADIEKHLLRTALRQTGDSLNPSRTMCAAARRRATRGAVESSRDRRLDSLGRFLWQIGCQKVDALCRQRCGLF